MLDGCGITELTVEADEARNAEIRPEAFAQHADHWRADLADEVFEKSPNSMTFFAAASESMSSLML